MGKVKHEFIKKILCLSFISVSLLGFSSVSANAEWRKTSNDQWNYFDNNGNQMKNTWFRDNSNGKWYYFAPNGYMARNTSIGEYKVGEDGAMITDNSKTFNNIGNTTTNNTINNINNGVINNYYGTVNNNIGNSSSNYDNSTAIQNIPITIPSTWNRIENGGYIINGRTAVIYKPKELQGYSYDKALEDIGATIMNDKNNSNIHTEYKKYNGYPTVRWEYTSVYSNGKIQKNCFIVVVTTSKLYGFMVVGDNDYGFDIDELDLELALSMSFVAN
jgi:hypothetical protein